MPFEFFVVSLRDDGRQKEVLNGFLRGHRVHSVERQWVNLGADSFWSFCVDYLDPSATSSTSSSGRASRTRVDYKEILSPDDFQVFQTLRELRKQISQEEAVPVYAVFTNEQLAEMARSKASTKGDLERIAGVGDARVEKHGARFLALLETLAETGNETGRTSVRQDP